VTPLPTEDQIGKATRYVDQFITKEGPALDYDEHATHHGILLIALLRDKAQLEDRVRDCEIRLRALEFPGVPKPDPTAREERRE